MSGQYFQSTKRGEINDLREELNSASRDKQRDAVKKVIAAMSVGKDVSALFADVINCVQSTSLEVKKLVYLYVTNYAKSQPELAILAVNTFRKDSLDPNPLIRALAVRTMGCIHLEAVVEYLMDPVRRCCRDQDAYVRKTAAICVSKLYSISPKMVEDQDFIEILQKELLQDANPLVVANAAASLIEIGNMSVRRTNRFEFSNFPESLNSMLNALNECNEWGQVVLLDAISGYYRPADSKEAKMIVDRVCARLSHKNSAVVMSATRLVIGLLDRLGSAESVRAVCRKLTGPLVSLMAESSEPEIQFIALRNMTLIMEKYPSILSGEIRVFFCRYNDPVYVKLEKLDAIVRLVSDQNADVILSELKEYASEVDVEFVRKAVRCIGRCAIRVESAADKCVNALLELIETKVNYVVEETVVVMRDIFRRFPNRYEAVISALSENLDTLDQPEAKAAMVWIIGEYADRIDNSGELLGSFVGEGFTDEPPTVQMQLLVASVKYFLKVKDASHAVLVKLLQVCTEQSENPDLRDRAYIYWRLLSVDPELCRKCIIGQKPLIVDDDATSAIEPEIIAELIREIGSIATVFRVHPNAFVRGAVVVDDPGSDYDEKNLEVVKKAMEAAGKAPRVSKEESEDESSEQSSDESCDSSSSCSSDEGLRVPDLRPVKLPVLPASAGKGVVVDGCLGKIGANRVLYLSIKNVSNGPVSQFAIQFNKNSFGLAPKSSAIDIGGPALAPGVTVDLVLPLDANKLNSGTPPSGLSVQVALRTNLEIFYFVIPFDLHVVLHRKGVSTFQDTWGAIASSQQLAGIPQVPAERVAQRLQQGGFKQCPAGVNGVLRFSSMTCNKLVVLLEVNLPISKVAVRASNVHIVPLAVALVQTLLSG